MVMLLRIHRLCPGDLNKRILDATRARIRAGEITERRLAEITHWSQPHISNVLAGKRPLNEQMADALVLALKLEPVDLYGAEQLTRWAHNVDPWRSTPPPAIAGSA